MEHFNGILSHKSGPANKQYTNQLNIRVVALLIDMLPQLCYDYHLFRVL